MFLPYKNVKKDNLLEKHLALEEKLLDLFKNQEVDIDQLLNIVQEFKKLRNFKESESGDEENLKNSKEKIFLVQDRELESEMLKCYSVVKDEIVSVYKYLSEDKTPILNLDKIKNFLTEFSKLTKEEIIFEEVDINDKILILSDKEENIPLRFKNGKKIILTQKNFDLSLFTHDELLEILRFLDLIIRDESYDYLRSEITKQIASISSFSSLK